MRRLLIALVLAGGWGGLTIAATPTPTVIPPALAYPAGYTGQLTPTPTPTYVPGPEWPPPTPTQTPTVVPMKKR